MAWVPFRLHWAKLRAFAYLNKISDLRPRYYNYPFSYLPMKTTRIVISYVGACHQLLRIVAAVAIAALPVPINATGTLTQLFDRPVTSSLSAGAQFFNPVKQTMGTTLPVTSVVVDESSTSLGAVTVPEPPGNESAQPAPVVTPVPAPFSPAQVDLSPREETVSQNLPVKVDDSSTAAQMLQLAEFERRNQIGEAFLLAVELVNKNPAAEFAYDAAIRNSLILGLDDEIERFYREAIKQSSLPGKYYVQLAHYYQRTGRMEQLQKLISDYAKSSSAATDYRITLARLFAVAGDQEALTALFEKQGFTPNDIFPLLQIQIKAFADAGENDKATSIILSAQQREFGMPQQRLLLQEILRLQNPDPIHVMNLVQGSLSNETNYQQARIVADNVVQEAQQGRYFTSLNDYLTSQAQERRLTDVERWMLALFTQKQGREKEALEVLTNETAGNTPVISFERARALTKAGRTIEAVPILSTLLSEQPDDLNIRLLLAEEMSRLKQTTNTLQLLASLRFSELPPDDQSRYATLIISSHISDRDTNRLLESWDDLAPQASFPVLQAMGDTVVRATSDAGFRDLVATAALRQIESRPNTWPLYLLLARLSAAEREPVAELNYYRQYLERDRDNVQMLRFVAELALLHASVPLTFGPEKAAPNNSITLRASESEATAAAVQFYRRLIDLQPRLPENYSALMRAYQTRGEIAAAKKVALEFADRSSSSASSLASAANMLGDNGFLDDALSLYRAALLAAPDQYDIWMNYATSLRQAEKFEPARDILKKILEEGLHGVPFNQPEVFANLLAMAQDQGTTPALMDYLDTVRAQPVPGKPEFYISSAKLLMQIESPEKAREFLEEFVSQHPESRFIADGKLLIGQIQFMDGDMDAALKTFNQIHDTYTTTPAAITAAFNIAEIQRQQGNVEQAIETWVQLAEEHPENDKALSAVHVAALSAWNDLKNPARAIELMTIFANSGSQDFELVQQARQSLQNMSAGTPPITSAPKNQSA